VTQFYNPGKIDNSGTYRIRNLAYSVRSKTPVTPQMVLTGSQAIMVWPF